MYFNDGHFSVSMSDFKWSHRNVQCWNDKGSEFNSPTNKPAALTTCIHMAQYHTSTLLRLRGPITCVIKDRCLSCLLTWTFPVKEWTGDPPTPRQHISRKARPSASLEQVLTVTMIVFSVKTREVVSHYALLFFRSLCFVCGGLDVVIQTWPGARHVCGHFASEPWRKTRVERADFRTDPFFPLPVYLLPATMNGPRDFLPVFLTLPSVLPQGHCSPFPTPAPVLIKHNLKISV